MKKVLESWKTCTRCPLHKYRKNVVLGEGSMPCDLLFVGEAPGKTENMMGRPFVGPSGNLLHRAIKFSARIAGVTELPSIFITNVCGCRPTDSKYGPNRPPKDNEVWACRSRLEAVVQACQPKAIILLGKVAQSKAGDLCAGATRLPHPAWIMRMGGRESPQYRAFCADLSRVLSGLKMDARRAVLLQSKKRKIVKKSGR